MNRRSSDGAIAEKFPIQSRERPVLMRSKTYRAKTMKEALTRVRRDLGGDAVILSAREVRRRRLFGLGPRSLVEVTATRHACRRRSRSRAGRRRARVDRPLAVGSARAVAGACRRGSAKSSAGCTRWSRP